MSRCNDYIISLRRDALCTTKKILILYYGLLMSFVCGPFEILLNYSYLSEQFPSSDTTIVHHIITMVVPKTNNFTPSNVCRKVQRLVHESNINTFVLIICILRE